MSTNSNHETDSRILQVEDAHQLPAAEADVQGYSLGLPGPLPAPEPPPGTTGGSVGEAEWDGTDRERPALMMPVRSNFPGLRFFTLSHL